MTEELKKRFVEIGDQSQEIDPIVVAKFFNPVGATTWLATEYYPEDNICFGYAKGVVQGEWNDEWGTFSVDELENIKLPLGLGIERDMYFKEKRFSEALDADYCKRKFPTLFAAREVRAKEEAKLKRYEERMMRHKMRQSNRSRENEDGLERA